MNGQYEEKFPQARALYMYMFAHPGKKLNFMGNEIGMLREWDENRELDWNILEYPIHNQFTRFMRDLNYVYAAHPAFWEKDFTEDGFQWLDCHQEGKCIYAIERCGKNERVAAVFNFSGVEQKYELHVENASELKLLLASDRDIYHGTKQYGEEQRYQLADDKVELILSANSAMYFEIK